MSQPDGIPTTDPITAASTGRTALGSVIELTEGGDAGVVVPGDPPLRLRCDVLRTADRPTLTLSLGERVLVLLPAEAGGRGCVLGVVAPYESPRPDPATSAEMIGHSDLSPTG